MGRKQLCGVGAAVLGVCLTAGVGRGEPVAGVNVGAALPTSTFRRSADVGGSFALFGGYRFKLGEKLAVSLLGEPQFANFSTSGCDDSVGRERCDSDDVVSIFSIGGGPRISLLDEQFELFFSSQPGYYREISGPLDDDGFGFNIAGGLNYAFQPSTVLGLFARYDQTNINATPNSTDDATFVIVGLSFQHRYLPPPPPPVAQAAAPPPPPPPAPTPAPVKKKIVLRGVNFDFDKAVIRADAAPILDQAIQTLKEYGDIRIAVQGHTDSTGPEAYNQQLSLRRAQAVHDYLAAGGIDADRMSVAGFGESQPVASNDTRDGRAQNRRVELRVVQAEN